MVLQIPFQSHEKGNIHVYFLWFPKLFDILRFIQRLYLSQQLGNWGHDEGKIPNKTLVQMGHVIENLNFLGVFSGNMLTNCKHPIFSTILLKKNCTIAKKEALQWCMLYINFIIICWVTSLFFM